MNKLTSDGAKSIEVQEVEALVYLLNVTGDRTLLVNPYEITFSNARNLSNFSSSYASKGRAFSNLMKDFIAVGTMENIRIFFLMMNRRFRLDMRIPCKLDLSEHIQEEYLPNLASKPRAPADELLSPEVYKYLLKVLTVEFEIYRLVQSIENKIYGIMSEADKIPLSEMWNRVCADV